MKYCSNCGTKFNESDKFCSNCGSRRLESKTSIEEPLAKNQTSDDKSTDENVVETPTPIEPDIPSDEKREIKNESDLDNDPLGIL